MQIKDQDLEKSIPKFQHIDQNKQHSEDPNMYSFKNNRAAGKIVSNKSSIEKEKTFSDEKKYVEKMLLSYNSTIRSEGLSEKEALIL